MIKQIEIFKGQLSDSQQEVNNFLANICPDEIIDVKICGSLHYNFIIVIYLMKIKSE